MRELREKRLCGAASPERNGRGVCVCVVCVCVCVRVRVCGMGGWLAVAGLRCGVNLNEKAANVNHCKTRRRERTAAADRPTSQPLLRDNKGGAGLTSRLLSAQLNI